MRPDVAPPCPRTRSLVGEVVREMKADLDDSSSAVSEAIHDNVEALADDMYPATRQSTRANLGLIATMLDDGASPTVFTAPEEALAYARNYVHQGLSIECLDRVYRQGQRAYTKLWLGRLQARATDAEALAGAMQYVNDWMFGYIETIHTPLSEVYTAEHERWIRGGVAMRSEEVRSILAGAHVDVTESSSRLRYRLDGRHVGYVIWRDTPAACDEMGIGDGHQLFGAMDRFAGEIAEALHARASLTLPIGRMFAGWAQVGEDVDVHELPAGRDGLRVAIGRSGRGVEGFRRTHQEAKSARRVAALAPRATTASASFDQLALDVLLTQDLEEARRFVRNELGPLMEDSDSARRLSATLEVFLQEGSSFVRAARRLGVHENTVAYRVRRAEELLGNKAADRHLELRAALRLARLVPTEGAAA